MSGTAQSRAQFLSQVRASFSQKPAAGSDTSDSPAQPSDTPISSPISSRVEPPITDLLDVLDKAMTKVEENVVQRAPTSAPLPQPPIASVSTPEPPAVSLESFALANAVPAFVDQSTQTLNPQQPTSSIKEVVAPLTVPEQPQVSMVESAATNAPVEVSGMGSYQEVGPVSPEIPPEIDAYLKEVKSHQEQLPHEIVVTNDDISLQPSPPPLRPVVVLPITPEVEKQGAHKSPAMSIRWLVEWSRRLMKMFTGKIMYQEPEATK